MGVRLLAPLWSYFAYSAHVNIYTSCNHILLSGVNLHTVDRENFAVKIISRSRPTAKIKLAKNKLRGDAQ